MRACARRLAFGGENILALMPAAAAAVVAVVVYKFATKFARAGAKEKPNLGRWRKRRKRRKHHHRRARVVSAQKCANMCIEKNKLSDAQTRAWGLCVCGVVDEKLYTFCGDGSGCLWRPMRYLRLIRYCSRCPQFLRSAQFSGHPPAKRRRPACPSARRRPPPPALNKKNCIFPSSLRNGK